MQRYHFDIINGTGLVTDDEGRMLDGPDEAREEGIKGIRSIIAEDALQGRIDLAGRLEIRDAAGDMVMVISFEEAVALVR
jgi:hypothetical protein